MNDIPIPVWLHNFSFWTNFLRDFNLFWPGKLNFYQHEMKEDYLNKQVWCMKITWFIICLHKILLKFFWESNFVRKNRATTSSDSSGKFKLGPSRKIKV